MQITVHETPTASVGHPLTSPVFPRFTAQQALILNIVASANPGYVTIDDILRKLHQTMRLHPGWFGPTRKSLGVQVASIRAKLGERQWQPSRLISVYEITPRGTRGELIGYAWKG